MAIEAFVEAFARGFALAIWFIFVFSFLLLACMVATAGIVILYGLRAATYATALGVSMAVPSGIAIGTTTGSVGVVLTALVVAFFLGAGVGYVRWGSGSAARLLEGTGYRILLVVISLLGVGSGLLFWAFLLGTVGMAVWEVGAANPGGFLVLLGITLAPVAAGGYVLKRLTLDHTVHHPEPT